MASVYAGVHRNGHAVAIKVLHEKLAFDPEFERLFRREAQLANTVSHPGIVPVIDDDVTDDGCVFLVMPLLVGETLRARAERNGGKLPVAEIFVVAHHVLTILGAAHAKKIVHRDIKPENIFVTTNGEIRVLDFGIGRFFEVNEPAHATRSGRALGTPAFMAPEQALGRLREVDGRTDLWAVGATMFSLLTGRFVHEAATSAEIAALAATRRAPRLGRVAPHLHETIAKLVDRSLAFRKEDRWTDASEMHDFLLESCQMVLGRNEGALARLPVDAVDAGEQQDEPLRPSPIVPRLATEIPPESALQPTTPLHGYLSPSEATRTAPETSAVKALALDARFGWSSFRNRARLMALIIAVLLITVISVVVVRFTLYRRVVASRGPERAGSSEANQAYLNGLAAWHDGRRADPELERALSLDPHLAAADLALSLVHPWPSALELEHFAKALRARATLEERDQALLDACEPGMRVPPDIEEMTKRLTRRATQFAEDFRFSSALGQAMLRHNDAGALLQLTRNALSKDPAFGSMWSLQALAYDLLGSAEDMRLSLGQCIKNALMPSTCQFLLATLESNEGHCDKTERLAQAMITSGEVSQRAFTLLGQGVYGRTQDLVALQHVRERAALDLDVPLTPSGRANQRLLQEILAGHFDDALAASRAFEDTVATSGQSFTRVRAAEYTITLAKELGLGAVALDRAKRFNQERLALDDDSDIDMSLDMDRYIYEAGAISFDEFSRRRKSWLVRQNENFKNRYGAYTFVWLQAFAVPARTELDAKLALEELPHYLPVTGPVNRSAYRDEAIGRVYLLAHQFSRALPFLTRAAHSCTAPEEPFSHLWAQLEAGLAYDALGERDDACRELASVLSQWGADHRCLTALRAKEKFEKLRCN